jgi:BirA family biotin operon repressor/biotin-[acetyl-CoA-carboxylase] ligase
VTEARALGRQPVQSACIDARFRVVRFDEIDSTNTEAKRRAAEGAPEFTVILAGAQTAGHGRRGRAWESPPGNLYSTLILRPACTSIVGAQISFVAALAVSDVARALVHPGASIACKWPNDVLVNGRKIAGILLESSASGGRLDWLVLGVGINVAHHPGVGGAYPSTSLHDESVNATDVERVAALYLDAFLAWYERWQEDGFAPVRAAWLARSLGLASLVTVKLERAPLEGRFVDLDESGALVLELASGARRVIAAGEVFFGAGGGHAARD